jgi:hypothetical protein
MRMATPALLRQLRATRDGWTYENGILCVSGMCTDETFHDFRDLILMNDKAHVFNCTFILAPDVPLESTMRFSDGSGRVNWCNFQLGLSLQKKL